MSTETLTPREAAEIERVKQLFIEKVAAVCHAVNRSYCRSMGDDSIPEWSDAPDWQKKSCIDGVKFHLENPTAGPEGSHENWLKFKEADGWTWGPEKNAELKTHPCMRPFHMLPYEQKVKDVLFVTIVHAAFEQLASYFHC